MLGDGSKIFTFAAKASIAAIALAFLYGLSVFYTFGGRFLGITEPPITISDIEVSTGDTVTPEMLAGWMRMERDAPLFPSRKGFHANRLANAYQLVSRNPTLSSLSVSREFSGKVTIHAVERIPLARVAGRWLAIDRDGYVFTFRKPGMEGLVAIEGALPASLETGNRIVPSLIDDTFASDHGTNVSSAMGLAALRLIDTISDGTSPIPVSAVRSVNIDNHDYLLIIFKDDRTVRLAWDCMKSSRESDGKDYLDAQLAGLAAALASRDGRAHRHFDFTIMGRGYGLRP